MSRTENLEDKKLKEIKATETHKNKVSDKVGGTSAGENIQFQDTKNLKDSRIIGENGTEVAHAPEHFSLLLGTQFNQQAAIMAMQQQEHELKTATVLSQQTEQLSKVSDSQHSLLHSQEKQFDALLKLQLEKQILLEKQIKLQQERINQYIQVRTYRK